ncbi:MAG: radical SAM protein [bacterium]|jgi:uncharacterized radical SAM superfamily protein
MDSLKPLLNRAWEVRCENFPRQVEFVYPEKTLSVSVTGPVCELDCAHCGGHYLRQMKSIAEAKQALETGEKTSCLVSGGCSLAGKVPILAAKEDILRLKEKGRLNLHVGLVDREEAEEIGQLADVVSFDFVADEKTIAEVYGIECTAEAYINSYLLLRRYVPVVPHICIGLNGGAGSGEERALSLLAELGAEAICFIVFIPTRNTRFAHKEPPPLARVARILAQARIQFPRTPLHLGCMRPRGRYRHKLDLLALKAGVNKIVMPTPAVRRFAHKERLEVVWGKECCVFG